MSRSIGITSFRSFQKDFNLGAIRASPKKWETIINEIKKCVLMCHNCHTESHYGLIDISKLKSPVIVDKFVNYKEFEKQIKMDKCPICGILKPAHNTTCSKECGAKIRYKIDWDKIDLLKELDECGSIVKVAEKIGCSDVIVGKRIKRLKNDLTKEKDKI